MTQSPMTEQYASSGTLFSRLRGDSAAEWAAYTDHAFVRGLGDGALPEAAFRHYLGQDYLFLIHFARAYALAAYKADDLEDIRAAAAAVSAIVDVEMGLHVEYCAGWGLTEPEMRAQPEDSACMAYTRYVLERGQAGDLLDLQVALAPCVIGYGEIGHRLAADPAARRDGNPYAAWIDMYAGDEYQGVASAAVTQLDRLAERRGGEARYASLLKTFQEATRLEADFWQMGLDAA
jgi:thiaminase/transcriptional activator TenA